MRWLLVLAAMAVCNSAIADKCAVQTARIMRATGATFDRRSPGGENVFLKHPLLREFTTSCSGEDAFGRRNVSLSSGNSSPSKEFFELVATAANSALGLPIEAVRAATLRCYRAAMNASDEMGDVSTKVLEVACQAYRRDGGNTFISVSSPRAE